jgi:hypothetical protein
MVVAHLGHCGSGSSTISSRGRCGGSGSREGDLLAGAFGVLSGLTHRNFEATAAVSLNHAITGLKFFFGVTLDA